MGGDVETIKERLDIAEVVGSYTKLTKAGQGYKARCPFHNEKTPSFYVSPVRQSYYCFGCGAKGDIFTIVEEMEGLDFREALKMLAERAGVELKRYTPESAVSKSEKERIFEALEDATKFFEKQLASNAPAHDYLKSRGLSEETIASWNLGYAPAEWRALYNHLLDEGHSEEILLKAGLIKRVDAGSGKNPYDVFRDRLIFPLRDQGGRVIAFSGRALAKDAMPKYLNSPDTVVFTKHDVLYGLDKAKDKIRRKDYTVLVEGQIDLVLSHQVGVDNTVASSGTAFTTNHLERLKKLSKRILLAFDGDKAGHAAAEKSAELAMGLGLEVKIARLPEGDDPAEVAKSSPEKWKNILREAKPAIEHFLDLIQEGEKDPRKVSKLIGAKILPLISLLESSMEKSHFISLIAKRTGIKEEIVWEDLRKSRSPRENSSDVRGAKHGQNFLDEPDSSRNAKKRSRSDEYQEVMELLKENPEDKDLEKHKDELSTWMRIDELDEEISLLRLNMDENDVEKLKKVAELAKERDEHRRKVL